MKIKYFLNGVEVNAPKLFTEIEFDYYFENLIGKSNTTFLTQIGLLNLLTN
jgi:hypothetical protein